MNVVCYQRRSQPKTLDGAKILHFRRPAVFLFGTPLLKAKKMTRYAKHFGESVSLVAGTPERGG